MSHPAEPTLDAIKAALTAQNQQFAALVEAFDALPPDMRLPVSPKVLAAIEATASTEPTQLSTPIGVLRA